MGNNDKKKKKKTAKSQPAVAKEDPTAKPKRAWKLISKAASRKNHLQDDTESEMVSSDDGDDVGKGEKEDIESVFRSQHERPHVPYLQSLNSWKDVEMSEALISAITDDPKIKQALFPSPGSNVSGSKGGGKPKTDFHWQLCQILFTNHDTYGAALQKVEECTDQKKAVALKRTWGIKIKNRLKK